MGEITKNDALDILKKYLDDGSLSIFVGSGISYYKPSCLPLWEKLIKDFIDFYSSLKVYYQGSKCETDFNNLCNTFFATQSDYDLIAAATAIKQSLQELVFEKNTPAKLYEVKQIETSFEDWLKTEFITNKQYNVCHEYIVSTDYRQILTTNYDNLLEEAAKANSITKTLSSSSYSFSDSSYLASAIYNKTSCIIHIHGKCEKLNINDIVLTITDYHAIKSNYLAFDLILNTIFLQNNILFVGYGGDDPHLQDILLNLTRLFEWKNSPSLKKFFILSKNKCPIRFQNNNSTSLDTIYINDYAEVPSFLKELKDHKPRT